MDSANAWQAFFIDADGTAPGSTVGVPNQRLCIYHPPQLQAGAVATGAVVYLHPFAEEMNKSRRMAALQSRALAQAGYAVLRIDLLGCGDSSGEFGDASWEAWIADALLAARWLLARHDAPLWWWGLRAGCLLASAAAARIGQPSNLLLWQAPASGKQLLQQFLRLKLAAEMSGGANTVGGDKTQTSNGGLMADLRASLAAGHAAHIAGYALAPALAQGLEAATLAAPPARGDQADRGVRSIWIDTQPRADAELLPATRQAMLAWQAAGHAVHGNAVSGPAFWQTQEMEDAPALIAATTQALAGSAVACAPAQRSGGSGGSAGNGMPLGATSDVTSGMAAALRNDRHTGVDEFAVTFGCQGQQLLGIASLPQPAAAKAATGELGLIIVVGGPQVRVGSHRMFVQMARSAAAAGVPALRFDVRGMGDSDGEPRNFEHISADIGSAIDALLRTAPSVRRVVLWGLCDGASAALLYMDDRAQDARVAGLCLLNPWVRSDASLARTHVRHYYLQRLRQRAFWAKLLRGQVAWQALQGLWASARAARGGSVRVAPTEATASGTDLGFRERMARQWTQGRTPTLLMMSAEDFTAREFDDALRSDPAWRQRGSHATRRTRVDIANAQHTLPDDASRLLMQQHCVQWLDTLRQPAAQRVSGSRHTKAAAHAD